MKLGALYPGRCPGLAYSAPFARQHGLISKRRNLPQMAFCYGAICKWPLDPTRQNPEFIRIADKILA
jgi:hypothetical protein